MGGGGGWGGVGRLKVSTQTNGNAVPSVSDPGWHNLQKKPGLLLESF